MAKSLQEQLRQAGLANQKQMVKARKAKNTKEKMQRKGAVVVDETAEVVKQKNAEKLARDRELNEKKNEDARARAIQAQIRQLITLNEINERGDVEFRFEQHGLIRTFLLQEDTRHLLIKGILAVVGQQDDMHIVPRKVAEKILERDNSWLILMNSKDVNTESEDDEYAGYEVPDDLMW